MYSCGCKYSDESFYCGSCMGHATNDDPNYENFDCPVCGKPTEVELDDGLHEGCEEQNHIIAGGGYCFHRCDGKKEHLIGRQWDEVFSGSEYFAGADIPTNLWTSCPKCETVSNKRHRGNNGDLEHVRCPNCNLIYTDGLEFVTPFEIILFCHECDVRYEVNRWPSEYYCDCCGGVGWESEYDFDEKDFYCYYCEKWHEDEEAECCHYDDDEQETYCSESKQYYSIADALSDDEEGDEEESRFSSHLECSIFRYSDIVGWNDDEIFYSVNCEYNETMNSRSRHKKYCNGVYLFSLKYDNKLSPNDYILFLQNLQRSGEISKKQMPVIQPITKYPKNITKGKIEFYNSSPKDSRPFGLFD